MNKKVHRNRLIERIFRINIASDSRIIVDDEDEEILSVTNGFNVSICIIFEQDCSVSNDDVFTTIRKNEF